MVISWKGLRHANERAQAFSNHNQHPALESSHQCQKTEKAQSKLNFPAVSQRFFHSVLEEHYIYASVFLCESCDS